MSKASLVAAATAIVLGAVTLHLVRELRSERARADQLQSRVEQLERTASEVIAASQPSGAPKQIAPNPFTAASSPPPVAKVAAKPAELKKQPPIERASEELERHTWQRGLERQRELLRNPEYRAAMQLQHKVMLGHNYPGLAAELGLSSEEADRFLDLLADHQLRSMERSVFMEMSSGDRGDMEQMERNYREWQQIAQREIADFLGPEKTQAWHEYQSSLGVRHQVAQLRSTFAARGAPLQEHQVKPLQRALAETEQHASQMMSQLLGSTSASTGTSAELQLLEEEQLQRMREHNQRVRESIAGLLTSEQLQILEEQQESTLKLQEAQIRMMRAQSEAERTSGTDAPAAAVRFFSDDALNRVE